MKRMVQQSLFERPTLNTSQPAKAAMTASAKASDLSRDQIVDRMNDLADRLGVRLAGGGKRLTRETLEKWLNPADLSRQMPMRAVPFFCAVTGDTTVLDVHARPLGAMVIGPDDQRLLRWAQEYQRARAARRAMRRLEAEM